MKEVTDAFGGVERTAESEDLKKIHMHTSKLQKLKETQFHSSAPLHSIIPQNLACFEVQKPMRKYKLSVDENAKQEWYNKLVNQMIISLKDDWIKQKYYSFMKENQIEIVSDIFERMERDRQMKDKLEALRQESARKGLVFDLQRFLQEKKRL